MALPNPTRQQAARKQLADVVTHPLAYAVHYACQGFYGSGQVETPRVVAIALRQVSTGQVTSFSVAQVAELNRIPAQAIPHAIDDIEWRILESYYAFVRTNRQARFIHWNMRDARFGFAAIEHRMTVLGGEPEVVHEQSRFDLAQLLLDIYGDQYVKPSGKMQALARLNHVNSPDLLVGAEEAHAIEEGRWRDVVTSTIGKVRIIAECSRRAHDGTLATEAGLVARHAGPVRMLAAKVYENPMASVVATGVGLGIGIANWLWGK